MSKPDKIPDRDPIAQGRFYPASSAELTSELDSLSRSAQALTDYHLKDNEELLALIVPHAGYVFSGIVAASAFNLMSGRSTPGCIFLLGSSHTASFHGASVYPDGNYITPLGNVPIAKNIAEKLLQHTQVFQFKQEAHTNEHSLEVQLAFIQHRLPANTPIVPIIIGDQSVDIIHKLAEILKPYFFDVRNLFIISTDLSHYPSFENANKIDKITVEAVCSNNPDIFLSQLKSNARKSIPGLATSMCGWTSIHTILNITHNAEKVVYNPVLYQNSGDAALYGDKSRVVGYQSIAITRQI